jgi:hypothetical protein
MEKTALLFITKAFLADETGLTTIGIDANSETGIAIDAFRS